jgi:hypothetical protein
MDETEGLVAYDSSGHRNHAMLAETSGSCWVPGADGGALDFRGDYEYAEVTDNRTLNSFGQISVAFWTKSGTGSIITKTYPYREDEWAVGITSGREVKFWGKALIDV